MLFQHLQHHNPLYFLLNMVMLAVTPQAEFYVIKKTLIINILAFPEQSVIASIDCHGCILLEKLSLHFFFFTCSVDH